MALSIKNREFEETARELAMLTGKSITAAALVGLKRELERQKGIKRLLLCSDKEREEKLAAIRDIQRHYAALPSSSTMTDDEVLGYDEYGIPSR